MADYYFSFSKMLQGVPGSRKYLGMELSLPFKNSFSKLLTGKAFNSENTHISIQSLKRVAGTFKEDRRSLGWNVGHWRNEHGRECALSWAANASAGGGSPVLLPISVSCAEGVLGFRERPLTPVPVTTAPLFAWGLRYISQPQHNRDHLVDA